jgi:hypothetical protein
MVLVMAPELKYSEGSHGRNAAVVTGAKGRRAGCEPLFNANYDFFLRLVQRAEHYELDFALAPVKYRGSITLRSLFCFGPGSRARQQLQPDP